MIQLVPKTNHIDYPHYRQIDDGNIFFSSDSGNDILESIKEAVKDGEEIIIADDFLENPEIIEGWKKPTVKHEDNDKMIKIKGKSYSESTIHEALKQYITEDK